MTAADDVEMKVKNGLTAVVPDVGHDTISTLLKPLCPRYLGRGKQDEDEE